MDFKSKNKDGFNIVGCLVLESNGNMLKKVFNYIKKENIPYAEWGGGLVESPKTIGYKMPSLLVVLMNSHPTFSSRIIMEIPNVFDLYDCRGLSGEMKRGYDIHEFCWLGKISKLMLLMKMIVKIICVNFCLLWLLMVLNQYWI